MILNKRGDLNAFRLAVRHWIASVLPASWKEQLSAASDAKCVEFQRWWMAERAKVGLAVPHWPSQYGGADISLKHQIIVAEEMARADAPPTRMYIVSLNHLPATLIPYGTEEQKRRYLSGIASGDVWCQGFSEPNAGSDLASLRCRALRKGDRYIVNGQKIWSSFSMYARYCILLARTSSEGPKHAGISYFLLDMKSPGIEVRPIRQANGRADFGEIFLTDVQIPAENLVGRENEGWKVAQATLSAERGVLAFEGAERQRYEIEAFYSSSLETNAPWLRDSQLLREFMSLLSELQAGRRLIRMLLQEDPTAQPSPSVLPAIVKLTGTSFRQRFCLFMLSAAGLNSPRSISGANGAASDPMFEFLSSFSGTIAGGSNEIMRNIIAERGLGMPRG